MSAAWRCNCPGLGPRPATVTRCLTCGAERPQERPGEFSVCELMEAWGELDQAIQRCYVPGRMEAEPHLEEGHLHDLRVKRDRMSRAITSLYLAQDDPS